ncbi:MAG: hypothetical protein KHZ90_08175 [Veillonella parvula]|uniref:Polymer-forming cytoskeletal protein n=1 Tax=Veillonella parvula TaxID=29466 RepID=A0A942WNA0_VEIPA|nr:hypothetical protein [Veillonella parvula]MBS4893736.1 hypothetical protein [Veillonella parvula]
MFRINNNFNITSRGNNNIQSINQSNGKCIININGKKTVVKGNNVNIVNNKIFIDGKEYTEHDELQSEYKTLNVIIEGNVDKINCQGSVEVRGNVKNTIDCGGSVSVVGDVDGSIDCGGSCNIVGTHIGDIDAGGSVNIK